MVDILVGSTDFQAPRPSKAVIFLRTAANVVADRSVRRVKSGSLILIDEPEISLHMDWQEIVIAELQAPLDGSRLLVATHSPDIVVRHRHLCTTIETTEEGGLTVARPSILQQKPRDFKRVLAQTALMGKSVAGFFHFEAYADSEWGRKFVKLWSAHDEEWLRKFDLSKPDLDRFVFTKTKSAAIKMHQIQRKAEGKNVCTVVDNHDARGKSMTFSKKRIGQEPVLRHRPNPRCTLSTPTIHQKREQWVGSTTSRRCHSTHFTNAC